MDSQLRLNDVADDLLIMNKMTVDALFRLENCADCIALYAFYYKTAKWQKTNTIKANDLYVKKCLKWGIDKIQRTKQALKENGLIKIVQRRANGKIQGWYVEVSYLVSQRKTEDLRIKVESNNTEKQQVAQATSGFEETNALKEKIKCLEKEIEMLKNKKKDSKKSATRFTPPTAEEVRDYCQERNNNVDAERFVDFYAAKGWKIGNSPMKDWKAAVRTWEKRDADNKPKTQSKSSEIDPEYLKYLDSLTNK